MVELFEQNIRTIDRQSSKGNQLKWYDEGIWYKADYTGYEGLAEYMISHLLKKSTLADEEFVLYDLEKIRYKTTEYNGVQSRDFVDGEWQIITVERLFKTHFGDSFYKRIWSINKPAERLKYLVEQVERITGLKDFGKYINKIFTIDAFFLNEDRHTHNIAVLMNSEGEFKYCPIFDNGAGLLADIQADYPMGQDVYKMMEEVKSKTICTDFDEQLDASEMLYKKNLQFNFTRKDVKTLLDLATDYPVEMRDRVEKIIYAQMSKYQYLFE